MDRVQVRRSHTTASIAYHHGKICSSFYKLVGIQFEDVTLGLSSYDRCLHVGISDPVLTNIVVIYHRLLLSPRDMTSTNRRWTTHLRMKMHRKDLQKTVVQTVNPNTPETGGNLSESSRSTWIEFQTSHGYTTRPCLKSKQLTGEVPHWLRTTTAFLKKTFIY